MSHGDVLTIGKGRHAVSAGSAVGIPAVCIELEFFVIFSINQTGAWPERGLGWWPRLFRRLKVTCVALGDSIV